MAGKPSDGIAKRQEALDALEYDFLAEKAAALGRAGEKMERVLKRLAESDEAAGEGAERTLKEAADAVYAYFIQRELCGLRRHDEIIRQYRIPGRVLVRLGAK
ncbi:DUF6665 family protein [Mesorhizobium xinjiangense]|uniref:DUF6665 family protein n=1 Tax=Mesorhizobium xinjiangense TaxID=2678685 RepID=UPI0012EE406D|nr:DUF6665 family protein [Mesorhizobium xinjiangense]